jgi:hypothetical protein
MSYPFYFSEEKDNIYTFETAIGVIYDIKFKPSDYLLGNVKTPYSDDLFEFIIELVFNPLARKPPLDKFVSITIASIIKDFYLKKNKSICIYICDSSDGKQDFRSRKFHDWFYNFNDLDLVKFDERIMDSAGNFYPFSLIISRKNPYFVEIICAFSEISAQNTK